MKTMYSYHQEVQLNNQLYIEQQNQQDYCVGVNNNTIDLFTVRSVTTNNKQDLCVGVFNNKIGANNGVLYIV